MSAIKIWTLEKGNKEKPCPDICKLMHVKNNEQMRAYCTYSAICRGTDVCVCVELDFKTLNSTKFMPRSRNGSNLIHMICVRVRRSKIKIDKVQIKLID